MRLARVVDDGDTRTAVVDGDEVVVLPHDAPSVDDIVRTGLSDVDVTAGRRLPLAQVRLAAPLARFNRDVLCTGWNYWNHYEESHGRRAGQDPAARPEHPTFFTKGPDTVIGPYDAIAWDPHLSSAWDYEAEIALVIGRDGRSIPERTAMDHVFGYLVANDVSQRDLQRAHGGQWLKGKSIDRTMPLGPWLTTTDEVDDPSDLRIQCELNGHRYQDASTRDMAFPFATLIAELSRGMTLRAGDVILTGTPAGIGNARDPQVFLTHGDLLVTRVDRLGELRNKVARTALT